MIDLENYFVQQNERTAQQIALSSSSKLFQNSSDGSWQTLGHGDMGKGRQCWNYPNGALSLSVCQYLKHILPDKVLLLL